VAIKRQLSGKNFAPESIEVLWQTYHAAILELGIRPSDKVARERLARLVIESAAPRRELNVDDLLAGVMLAWDKADRTRPHL
jgi:hypothetical protein